MREWHWWGGVGPLNSHEFDAVEIQVGWRTLWAVMNRVYNFHWDYFTPVTHWFSSIYRAYFTPTPRTLWLCFPCWALPRHGKISFTALKKVCQRYQLGLEERKKPINEWRDVKKLLPSLKLAIMNHFPTNFQTFLFFCGVTKMGRGLKIRVKVRNVCLELEVSEALLGANQEKKHWKIQWYDRLGAMLARDLDVLFISIYCDVHDVKYIIDLQCLSMSPYRCIVSKPNSVSVYCFGRGKCFATLNLKPGAGFCSSCHGLGTGSPSTLLNSPVATVVEKRRGAVLAVSWVKGVNKTHMMFVLLEGFCGLVG